MFWSDFTPRFLSDSDASASNLTSSSDIDVPTSPSDEAKRHSEDLLRDALDFANKATYYDSIRQSKTAIFYYVEAIQAMFNAVLANPELDIAKKYSMYVKRVEELKKMVSSSSSQGVAKQKSKEDTAMEKANFLIRQAFDEDDEGNKEEAAAMYMEAAEICIDARKTTKDRQLKEKLEKLATQALDRAESLKKEKEKKNVAPILDLPSVPSHSLDVDDDDNLTTTSSSTSVTGDKSPNRTRQTGASKGPKPNTGGSGGGGGGGGARGGGVGGGGGTGRGGGGRYTPEEIAVLRKTSFINGREYVPFISQADLRERFGFPVSFVDKAGKLSISPKQKERFGRWVRIEDISSDPHMILTISSFSIKQTIVQDCSFVASMAISANYERRFKKKLISNIVYPQNKEGQPVYNPCGKYMVILHINGVKRKVIIDDFLPEDRHGSLLCSFSSNRNEFWVSIMEKAYMKVMGGYDFPGSNSNIDLHALTGWIPERVAIRLDSAEFNKDEVFKKMISRFHVGNVLITVATGVMSDVDADRAGLVPTHAYALLDIREIKGKKLIQLKNPWSHLRWKGHYSEFDEEQWTPELQKALNFDPKNAQQFDNGVFWIDYDSLCHFYDVIYMNWNPSLFAHTYVLHNTWQAGEGPKKDSYVLSNNPQYRLDVKGKGGVWILLTRHITDKDDFADNKEFITLLIYKGGKKVFYPNEAPPYIDGTRINSPHYLCKMVVKEDGTSSFTVVVSQFEKSNTIHYSLRVYSTISVKLYKVPDPYQHSKQLTGEWKGKTAGGCANFRDTVGNNPIYQVSLQEKSKPNYFMVDLKGPRDFHVGFELNAVSADGTGSNTFQKLKSGDYRRGFTALQLEDVPGGIYNVMPTTFQPGQEAPFFLTISASCPIKVVILQ
ncbi:calpain-7-like [Anneissia japonica]|uniref:calpain-7-like n=1 Tax=Anneissia japonica TaxID=1529436 RepID=UPI00142563CB|nr:calpain-7-like [Anneissia japonica]XP_033104109.1 calpain-7-like [Anneissia japonica]